MIEMEWRPRPHAWRRRRAVALRLVAGALLIWLFYANFADQFHAERREALTVAHGRPVKPDAVMEDVAHAIPAPARHDPQAESPQTPLQAPQISVTGGEVTDTDSIRSNTQLESALREVISLLPDEALLRDLLRPIERTGEEKLRELGLRTRSFKKHFAAWEALHLVVEGSNVYARNDIVRTIRQDPRIATALQMDVTQVLHAYEAYRAFITRFAMLLFPWTMPYFSDHISLHAEFHHGGKGLVFCAGDNHAPFLLTSIPSIRRLGCNLPIEVMYLGDGDLSQDFRAKLEAMPGVVTRDVSQMVTDRGWKLAGWAGKPWAILFSSFREAMFIDADALFFQNPENLFDHPSYRATGALFFRDRFMMPESKKKWMQQILPRPISKKATESRFWTGDSGHMQESGVVVVDKWVHYVALLLVARMNGPDRDGNAAAGRVGVYDMVYGDKETFWLGWELVGDTDYAFHQGDAATMGTLEPQRAPEEQSSENPNQEERPTQYTICAPQLLHLDEDGKPLWFNGWLLANKYSGKKNEPARFETYIQEPREVRDPGAWQLHSDNICCLTAENAANFTEQEKDTLAWISEAGYRAGAFGGKKV
ncbi:mannosyltransferase putative-domain-containing protein [Aspergillus taichungensis]|uniref:Mannosyltransferase putative-domain-containing protein n=1 Tax=Aspergillus taichungensis TaxID=482145 RepID=A0A2J5HRQ9_9EURO|nr:mannosyltransferase putative-domain-containing protein [Aspergillus taichungensis]